MHEKVISTKFEPIRYTNFKIGLKIKRRWIISLNGENWPHKINVNDILKKKQTNFIKMI